MSKIILCVTSIVLIILPAKKTQATIITIGEGESYHDYTVKDSDTLNIVGGYIEHLTADIHSTVNMSGGYVSDIQAWGNAIVNVTGGQVDRVYASQSSAFYIHAGNLDRITAYSEPYFKPTEVHIYGMDFEYIPPYPNPLMDNGELLGLWPDGTNLYIEIQDALPYHTMDYVILHVIPEPATLLLLGLGAMMVRRKNANRL